jgi:hypothetical protein
MGNKDKHMLSSDIVFKLTHLWRRREVTDDESNKFDVGLQEIYAYGRVALEKHI